MADRKTGSNILVSITGAVIVVLGILIFFSLVTVDVKTHRDAINGSASVLFGAVLLWWAASEDKQWGIGFETVTMTVAVVAGLIAILTLTSG